MKGIDISNYQRGLDLGAIDYDFVFCKATEGTGIVHDTCDPFIQKAISMGKCWGLSLPEQGRPDRAGKPLL